MYKHTFTHVHPYTYKYTYMYIYMHVCAYTHLYIHIYFTAFRPLESFPLYYIVTLYHVIPDSNPLNLYENNLYMFLVGN